MHFSTLIATALPLAALTAQALPAATRRSLVDSQGIRVAERSAEGVAAALLERRDFINVDGQGLPAAEKGANGLGAALGSGSSSFSNSGSNSNSNSGSNSNSNSGSNSNSNSSSGKGAGKQNNSGGAGQGKAAGQGASSTSSANKPAKTRPCDQGDQSLQSGLQAFIPIGLGQQASVVTIKKTIQGQQANQKAFQTAKTRLQQFIQTAKLQLSMANAIADDDSFAQTQLKQLAQSITQQESATNGLKGDQSDLQALESLAKSFRDSTDLAQKGINEATVDCFLPFNAVSG